MRWFLAWLLLYFILALPAGQIMVGKFIGILSLSATIFAIILYYRIDRSPYSVPGLLVLPAIKGQEPLPTPEPGPMEKSIRSKAIPPSKKIAVYSATLKPKGAVLERMKSVAADPMGDSGSTLVLVVEGAVLPDQPPLDARVYVIKLGATIPISIEDSGFVSEFSLGAIEQAGKPISHNMDLTPVVRKLASSTDWFRPELPLNLVVVGVDASMKVVPIPFRGMTLTVHE